MKKIINEPSNFVKESIQGLVASHPDIYAYAKDNESVVTRSIKANKKAVTIANLKPTAFQLIKTNAPIVNQ